MATTEQLATWANVTQGISTDLERYDAGLLADYGGGNVEWWQDYIRAELDRAHDHYQMQADAFFCAVDLGDGWIRCDCLTCPVDPETLIDGIIWREGGRHEWGAYFRAGDMKDREWSAVYAYRAQRAEPAADRRDVA